MTELDDLESRQNIYWGFLGSEDLALERFITLAIRVPPTTPTVGSVQTPGP